MPIFHCYIWVYNSTNNTKIKIIFLSPLQILIDVKNVSEQIMQEELEQLAKEQAENEQLEKESKDGV